MSVESDPLMEPMPVTSNKDLHNEKYGSGDPVQDAARATLPKTPVKEQCHPSRSTRLKVLQRLQETNRPTRTIVLLLFDPGFGF